MSISFNPPRGTRVEDIIVELEKRIRALEKRVIVLEPETPYPALREAYNHYKLIEKLTLDDDAT